MIIVVYLQNQRFPLGAQPASFGKKNGSNTKGFFKSPLSRLGAELTFPPPRLGSRCRGSKVSFPSSQPKWESSSSLIFPFPGLHREGNCPRVWGQTWLQLQMELGSCHLPPPALQMPGQLRGGWGCCEPRAGTGADM